MPLTGKRGVTLIETMIALAMLSIVTAVLLRLLAGHLRLYQSNTQRMDRDQALRTAAAVLSIELRDLNAADGDILVAAPTALSFRAMRQLAFVCAMPRPGAEELAVRERPLFGVRAFDPATDSLLVFRDDDWLRGGLGAVRAGVCDDGSAARLLASPLAGIPGIAVGAPVRGFEIASYRQYRAGDGQWYLGLATGPAGVIQPLAGPLTANGLIFTYRDTAGNIAAEVAAIAAIEIRVRALTAQPVRSATGALTRPVDSAVAVVALRNGTRR